MFPFDLNLEINSDLHLNFQVVMQTIWPLLTEERRQKITRVAAGRCFDIAVVMDGIYDRGNISAVLRTGEGMGFANFHVIESQEKFKEANRVTAGADKWVEIKKWKSPTPCIAELKKSGFRILSTTLQPHSKPLHEIDFSIPSAIVLGNEKDGVSEEMIRASDECIMIPMPGFVQSFNISVAGAISMYHILRERQRMQTQQKLTLQQQEILKAVYSLRTLDSATAILKEKFSKREKV